MYYKRKKKFYLPIYDPEILKWSSMSVTELEKEKKKYSKIAGSKTVLKAHRLLFNVTLYICAIFFWSLIFYVSWLPFNKINNLIPNHPFIVFILGGSAFCLFLLFISWGLVAEDEKLFKKVISPFESWETKLIDREFAAFKKEEIELYIKNKNSFE